jgi:hypothetical protein
MKKTLLVLGMTAFLIGGVAIASTGDGDGDKKKKAKTEKKRKNKKACCENQCILVKLLVARVMACCFTARVAVGSDPDVIDVFRLVCQRRFRSEDNSR